MTGADADAAGDAAADPGGSSTPVTADLVIADLVIEDVTALVHGVDGAISFLDHATIVVTNGAIASVSAGVPAGSVAATERIRASGRLAMPGFINCHTHSPMVMFRGAAEDIPIERWFNDFIWPMEVNMTDDDVEVAARLAAAEMIQSGVTTFADHYFSMPTIARVVDETGLRANLGSTFFSSDSTGLETSLDFALTHRGAAGGRITTSLAPHAPYTVTDADLALTAAAALANDLMIHVHAGETRKQTHQTRDRRGKTPVQILADTGILHARTLIAHGIGIMPEDSVALLAAADHVGVATAPRGYLKETADTTPVRLLESLGVAVGLGTDGAASNNTLDVWESMTFLTLVQKAFEGDPTWLTSEHALRIATLGSARAIGLAGVIGSLAPGHRADIVLVDLDNARSQPIHSMANTIVHAARSSDVVTTIVDGRILMLERQLTTIDLPAVIADLRPRLDRLTERDHGESLQSYGI
ncbi:amidohydrolase [Subtercola endophyticus]|uniref:amidohydrolase n=1 Tax=Subtercola endophyticus TaxID=2895559 RepID=UPI001E3CCE98|nr:amidohydrolase [Subtercola endophyticus]UFS58352.1 amidohydrolase [Subtercola endophyticus]